MEKDTGIRLAELKVDGGASRDAFLMQFQADIMAGNILRPAVRETTALGAASLAGIAVGFWKDQGEVKSRWKQEARFVSAMTEERRETLLAGWRKAVGRSRAWAD
jgi:glycerol kinase